MTYEVNGLGKTVLPSLPANRNKAKEVTELIIQDGKSKSYSENLFTILCKCLFLKVTVKAVTKLDNKAAHCH